MDDARTPIVDVILRAIDLRWNWLHHILRMDECRLVRRVLLHYVRPTSESIAGDVIYVISKQPFASRKVEFSETRIGP